MTTLWMLVQIMENSDLVKQHLHKCVSHIQKVEKLEDIHQAFCQAKSINSKP